MKTKQRVKGMHPMIKNMVDIPGKMVKAIDFHKQGNLREAGLLYREVLQLNPKHFDALHLLGCVEADLQNYQFAYECMSKALEQSPDNHFVLNNRANLLRECGKFELALIDANKAANKEPDWYEVNVNLSAIHYSINDFDTALVYSKKAAEIKPEEVGGFLNWGNCLKEQGDMVGAIEKFIHCTEIKPEAHGAYSNLATCYKDMYNLDLSQEYYKKAKDLVPWDGQIYYNLSLVELLAGDYENGWRNHEWRWRYKGFNTPILSDVVNSWKGDQELTGKTIMVWHEQGLGDTIQFSRYCKILKERGAKKVYLWVQKPLAKLMTCLPFVDQVIVEQGDYTWDTAISLMALPFELKTTVETIPNFGPYITADAILSQSWAERLGPKQRPRVGLVWSGGLRADQPHLWTTNQRRNAPLHLFSKLKDLDIDFFSLQKGDPGEKELKLFQQTGWDGPDIINYTDQLLDFSDTAALIDNLDLVISVDTSTAHLAAAMGKPTWILNRHDTCWRWFLYREDSPWYDSVRLFRQPKPGDWASIIDKVYAELQKNFK